jgi:hypothetical protein
VSRILDIYDNPPSLSSKTGPIAPCNGIRDAVKYNYDSSNHDAAMIPKHLYK